MPEPAQRSPAVGCSSPFSSLISTVLPAPLGPMTPTRSPRTTVRSTPISTGSNSTSRSSTTRWPPRVPAHVEVRLGCGQQQEARSAHQAGHERDELGLPAAEGAGRAVEHALRQAQLAQVAHGLALDVLGADRLDEPLLALEQPAHAP